MENNIKTYNDLIKNEIHFDGYYNIGSLVEYDNDFEACDENSMVSKSKKIAKSMKAMAMISQLMPYYGGEITDNEWEDGTILKYCITARKNKIRAENWIEFRQFLAFHEKEQRDEFLKYNRQLVKDYLMID